VGGLREYVVSSGTRRLRDRSGCREPARTGDRGRRRARLDDGGEPGFWVRRRFVFDGSSRFGHGWDGDHDGNDGIHDGDDGGNDDDGDRNDGNDGNDDDGNDGNDGNDDDGDRNDGNDGNDDDGDRNDGNDDDGDRNDDDGDRNDDDGNDHDGDRNDDDGDDRDRDGNDGDDHGDDGNDELHTGLGARREWRWQPDVLHVRAGDTEQQDLLWLSGSRDSLYRRGGWRLPGREPNRLHRHGSERRTAFRLFRSLSRPRRSVR
jgi:hypothetical protein